MKQRKNFLLTILAIIVVGALLGREYPKVGMIISVVTIAVYILVDINKTILYLRNFSKAHLPQKIKVISVISMLFIIIIALTGGGIYYFMMLALLAIDYLILENTKE